MIPEIPFLNPPPPEVVLRLERYEQERQRRLAEYELAWERRWRAEVQREGQPWDVKRRPGAADPAGQAVRGPVPVHTGGQLGMAGSPGCVATHPCANPGCTSEARKGRPWGEYCSDRCRTAAWDRKHPRIGLLPFGDVVRPGHQAKAGRLKAAAGRILGRLQEGPATNMELLRVGGMRYGARLFELRQRGHRISTDEDKATGRVVYRLEQAAS